MEKAILLATYNGAEYLEIQIESLLAQTRSDFTIYIHDDGSIDKTPQLLMDYSKRYPDKIKLLKGKSMGSAKANFLWMLSQVEAQFYFLCDQDDVWFPEKVEKSLARIEENTVVPQAVFTDMLVVDESLQPIADSFIRYIGRSPYNTAYTQILIDNPAAGCTMCINKPLRDIVVESLAFIDLKNIPMHDALILELAAIKGILDVIDEPLVYYRQTGHNQMGAITESLSDKVSRNRLDAAASTFLEKKRVFINEARAFAAELIKIPNLPQDKKLLLNDFVHIDEKGKLARMRFYRQNNFTRAHHNLWMRLWV